MESGHTSWSGVSAGTGDNMAAALGLGAVVDVIMSWNIGRRERRVSSSTRLIRVDGWPDSPMRRVHSSRWSAH